VFYIPERSGYAVVTSRTKYEIKILYHRSLVLYIRVVCTVVDRRSTCDCYAIRLWKQSCIHELRKTANLSSLYNTYFAALCFLPTSDAPAVFCFARTRGACKFIIFLSHTYSLTVLLYICDVIVIWMLPVICYQNDKFITIQRPYDTMLTWHIHRCMLLKFLQSNCARKHRLDSNAIKCRYYINIINLHIIKVKYVLIYIFVIFRI